MPGNAIRNNLLNVLEHVTRAVPFYQKFHHLFSGEIPLEEALHALPVIDKSFVKANFNLLSTEELRAFVEKKANNIDAHEDKQLFFKETTSGTTGSRLTCYKTNSERIRLAMSVWKRRKIIDPLVNQTNTFCLVHVPVTQEKIVKDIHDYSAGNIAAVIQYLAETCRPRMIHGGPAILCAYAKFIEENKISLKGWRPSFIEVNGQGMTPWQRDYISRIFSCKVINNYGTIEVWNVAYECLHGRLHLSDDVHLEIRSFKDALLLPAGCHEPGEIIVTSLALRSQPFVRYNLKDIGWLSEKPCSCGIERPVIYLHEARTVHYLNGHVSTGSGVLLFNQVMEELSARGYNGIKKYKVYQQKRDLFDVYIAGSVANTQSFCTEFTDSAAARLGRKPVFNFSFIAETDEVFVLEKDYSFISKVVSSFGG